nr:unnamed protein product [Digitaria exilis]
MVSDAPDADTTAGSGGLGRLRHRPTALPSPRQSPRTAALAALAAHRGSSPRAPRLRRRPNHDLRHWAHLDQSRRPPKN